MTYDVIVVLSINSVIFISLTCKNVILDEIGKVDNLLSFRHGIPHLSRLLLHLLCVDSIGRVFRVGRPQCTIPASIAIHRRTDAVVNSKRLGHVVEHSFFHLEKSRGEDGTGNSRLDGKFVREVKGSVVALVVVPGGIT